ncbi:hypothetical protein IOQ59_11025 [Pontibacterium sp. N1Y112]|uniref:Uncharacterized protein n=1 Tax=Pontibacterium sinense TaxID=2781979 RepID=A0A8J7FE69_9GAMM|nr:hypothetical protein [Pontibacterium sinense]MBE9397789.1 hypothetical protein [Pontibacterium sinense]
MSDEFEGAASPEKNDFVNKAGKTPAEEVELLLMVGGQISGRKENYSKSQTYYLHNTIDEWIRTSGKAEGNLQVIVNYLLKRGIEAVEKEGRQVMINASKFKGLE